MAGVRLALVVSLVLVGACSSAPTAVPAAAAPPGDSEAPTPLAVSLEQGRSFAARHLIEVVIRNIAAQPVPIQETGLDSPLFVRLPRTPREVVLAPGARVDLPIEYGAALCDAAPAGSAVQLRIDESGQSRDLLLELPDPEPLLARLHVQECTQQAIAAAVTVEFGPTWERTGDTTMVGSLVLRRRSSAEPVSVSQIAGTVVFSLRVVPERLPPLLELPPESAVAELPIEVTAARCDTHALVESKRSFLFPVWVTVGEFLEQPLTIEAEGDARRLLDELLLACLAAAPAAP